MVDGIKTPERLFKYCSLTARTLGMIVADNLYFADPGTFNDPLDTRPSLEYDVSPADLAEVAKSLIAQRTRAEILAAADTLGARRPQVAGLFGKRIREGVDRAIANIEYDATHPDCDQTDGIGLLLCSHIEVELMKRYDFGVVSLTEQDNCPLMWSHYGDQHSGVSIGYSAPERISADLRKVTYGGSRTVQASDVAAMLDGDSDARARVVEAVFLRKAEKWNYESEWRLIGRRGVQDSMLELKEITFGMRCDNAVKYAVVKALEDGEREIEFYESHEQRSTFSLAKSVLNREEFSASFPRRYLSIYEEFGDSS